LSPRRNIIAAPSPARRGPGLVDEKKKYNVNGILSRRVGELGEEED
jgi:hypothetical protein